MIHSANVKSMRFTGSVCPEFIAIESTLNGTRNAIWRVPPMSMPMTGSAEIRSCGARPAMIEPSRRVFGARGSSADGLGPSRSTSRSAGALLSIAESTTPGLRQTGGRKVITVPSRPASNRAPSSHRPPTTISNDDAQRAASSGCRRTSASAGGAFARNALVGRPLGARAPREREGRESRPGGRARNATASRAGLAPRRRAHKVQPPGEHLLYRCGERWHLHTPLSVLLARRALVPVARELGLRRQGSRDRPHDRGLGRAGGNASERRVLPTSLSPADGPAVALPG